MIAKLFRKPISCSCDLCRQAQVKAPVKFQFDRPDVEMPIRLVPRFPERHLNVLRERPEAV